MTKATTSRFLFVVVATATVIGVVASRLGGAENTANTANEMWNQTRAGQLVFFAVLEGLYCDGVANEDVDLVIPPGKDGKPTFDREHFVYACPLCHPAFEAFRLYRERTDFFGFKVSGVNTFGPGLDPTIKAQLRSGNANERRQAIQQLISRWVSRRLEMMRLTDAERQDITNDIERGRKRGMSGLKNAQDGQASLSRTNCPICDGSFGACRLQVVLPPK